jgi:hypothetical protein
MATKNELLQFTITNNTTDCNINVPFLSQDSPIINARKKYTWNITGLNLGCGCWSIVINNQVYQAFFNGTLIGLIASFNNLGFSFFCSTTSGGNLLLYTLDDYNVYGNVENCFCTPITTSTTTTTTTPTPTTTTSTTTTTTTPTPTTSTTTTTTTPIPTTTTSTTTTTTTPTPTTTTTSTTTTTTTPTPTTTTTSTTTTTTTPAPTIYYYTLSVPNIPNVDCTLVSSSLVFSYDVYPNGWYNFDGGLYYITPGTINSTTQIAGATPSSCTNGTTTTSTTTTTTTPTPTTTTTTTTTLAPTTTTSTTTSTTTLPPGFKVGTSFATLCAGGGSSITTITYVGGTTICNALSISATSFNSLAAGNYIIFEPSLGWVDYNKPGGVGTAVMNRTGGGCTAC